MEDAGEYYLRWQADGLGKSIQAQQWRL